MKVFKEEQETKRVIFNIDHRNARRLDRVKKIARKLGKKLNVDAIVDEALHAYLDEAERHLGRLEKRREESSGPIVMGESAQPQPEGSTATSALQVRGSSLPDNPRPKGNKTEKQAPSAEKQNEKAQEPDNT